MFKRKEGGGAKGFLNNVQKNSDLGDYSNQYKSSSVRLGSRHRCNPDICLSSNRSSKTIFKEKKAFFFFNFNKIKSFKRKKSPTKYSMKLSENIDTDLDTAVGYLQVQGHLSDRTAAWGYNYHFLQFSSISYC